MRHFLDFARLVAIGVSTVTALAAPAYALVILPSFDTSIASRPNAAALEAAINTAAITIQGLYSNPGTVGILFQYNSGVLGETQTSETFVPWSQYVAQLAAQSAAHPSNGVLATAVANIGTGNTGNFVLGTTAFLRVAMGFVGTGTTPCFSATGGVVGGCNAVNDAVITIGNVSTSSPGAGLNSQAVSVVEHEMNEALGGGGTGTTIGENLSAFITGVGLGPIDLYRFHATGSTCASLTSTGSYTTNAGEIACYSYDGGKTSLVQMNQAGGGSDYGDFATTSPNVPYIQDAFYPGTTNVYSDFSPEFQMMESIAWDAPEPSSLALFAGAIGGLGWLRRRRDASSTLNCFAAPG